MADRNLLKTYQRRKLRVGMTLCWSVLPLIGLSGLAASRGNTASLITAITTLLIGGLGTFRASQMATIKVGADEVRVQSIWRTHVFSRDSVSRFVTQDARGDYGATRGHVLVLQLADRQVRLGEWWSKADDESATAMSVMAAKLNEELGA